MSGSVASLARRCVLTALAFSAPATAFAQAAPATAEAGTLSAAPADARLVPIDWRGPADCERGAAVRAKVLRLLGGNYELAAGVKVSVTVRHEKGARYVAELQTITASGGGTKRLEGESCEAIALASSVVIALSLDPNASLDADAPEETTPREAAKPKPKPKARPMAKRKSFAYLHGSVGVLFGLLSIPSAFISAGLGARHRRFSVELAGAIYQPRAVARVNRPKVGAKLHLYTGELLGCFAALPFELGALELCPGLRLEVLSATAYGVSNPDQARVLLASGLGALGGGYVPPPGFPRRWTGA